MIVVVILIVRGTDAFFFVSNLLFVCVCCCCWLLAPDWKPTGMKTRRLVGTNKMNVMNEGHGVEYNFGRGSRY